jgi:hypothetical protein
MRGLMREQLASPTCEKFSISVYEKRLGFPDSLPDLAAKRPRKNLRPDGVQQSFRARLQRGELALVY